MVLAVALGVGAAASAQTTGPRGNDDLPDAPSALMSQAGQESQAGVSSPDGERRTEAGAMTKAPRPCKERDYSNEEMPLQGPPPCMPENPISPFVTSEHIQPLSSKEKGVLAFREYLDPFNFVTIAAYSGIAVAANSHSAYGPAFKGWAKLTGYGLVESAQADFVGTYAIPSVMHEDPRYHRMPTASVKRRLWHAVVHTVVSQHDDGRPMLNYATLLTYPISAELSNLYVPGIPTNAPSTARRVAIGFATDPVPQIVAEFLPDVAKHVHIHAQFAQELIDRAAGVNPAAVQ
jgi:hypothetical protein